MHRGRGGGDTGGTSALTGTESLGLPVTEGADRCPGPGSWQHPEPGSPAAATASAQGSETLPVPSELFLHVTTLDWGEESEGEAVFNDPW